MGIAQAAEGKTEETYEDVTIVHFTAPGCQDAHKDASQPIPDTLLKGKTVKDAEKDGLECVDEKSIKLTKTKSTLKNLKLKDDITVDNGNCQEYTDEDGTKVSMRFTWKGLV